MLAKDHSGDRHMQAISDDSCAALNRGQEAVKLRGGHADVVVHAVDDAPPAR